jgi:hypothetical protein
MHSLLPTRLTKLACLNADEWRILLAAAWLLPATALSLRVFGYRRTRAWMERHVSPNKSEPTDAAAEAARVTRLVSVAAHHGAYRANCLRQALVAWWLLGRRGIGADLVIGVRKDAHGFAAHAWVEFNGEVIIGGADSPERFRSMH